VLTLDAGSVSWELLAVPPTPGTDAAMAERVRR
jgi:hypothetical protein